MRLEQSEDLLGSRAEAQTQDLSRSWALSSPLCLAQTRQVLGGGWAVA